MDIKPTNNRQKGQIAEDIGCLFLVKHGYSIAERNYLKKWGEIDIIAQKDKKLHFFEVKSVFSAVYPPPLQFSDNWRPEENVHSRKLTRLSRTVSSYISERYVDPDLEISFGVLSVLVDMEKRIGRVKMIKNVIL